MSLRPSESFLRIVGVVRIAADCLGVDTYDPNYKVNIRTAMTFSIVIIYTWFTITTVIRQSNWMFTLQALVMLGFVIQSMNKLYIGVRYSQEICELNQGVVVIYKQFEEHPDPRYARRLHRVCRRLRNALIIAGLMYAIGILGMICLPICISLFTDQFMLIMHFHIPGIDVNTKTGAWITQAVHAVSMTFGGLGLLAGDTTIIVHLLQPYIFLDILRLKVDSFNNLVEEPDNLSESDVQNMLVDIMQFHQMYLNFISLCNMLCSSIVSTQVCSAAVCILMTIFVVLTSDWLSGYCFGIVLIPNLYIYCILGTVVENCNSDIMYEVYNISFYNLKPRQQRQVLFMLSKSQQPDMMQVLGIMPLSVSTALQFTKSIYSTAMMIINFLPFEK